MKHIKNIVKLVVSGLAVTTMLSCKDNSSNVIKDEEIIEKVTNYQLEYPSQDPGCEISYHHMWDGTDTKNMFGPNYSNENRLFTYLLSYEEETDDYYFVYVNKDSLSIITNWLETYLESKTSDNECQFDKDVNIVDGKYLLGAKNNDLNDFLVTHSDNISQKLDIDGYRMALCLKAKNVNVVKNASTKTEINKKLQLFKRVPLKYDQDKSTFAELSSDYFKNDKYVNERFSRTGEWLETNSKSFVDRNCLYAPSIGIIIDGGYYKSVSVQIFDKGILLPRKDNGYDLLDKNVELPLTVQDVYQDYRDDFLDAFIEYKQNSSTGDGYFDTNKVLSILK